MNINENNISLNTYNKLTAGSNLKTNKVDLDKTDLSKVEMIKKGLLDGSYKLNLDKTIDSMLKHF